MSKPRKRAGRHATCWAAQYRTVELSPVTYAAVSGCPRTSQRPDRTTEALTDRPQSARPH